MKPYLLIGPDRSQGEIYSDLDDDFSGYSAVVMEQGIENLEQHMKCVRPLRTEMTAIAHKVALIVEAAHNSNIFLMDFKPSNIFRFKDDRDMPVWKAIDFDSNQNLYEEVLKDVTPGVCSYEMAKYH